MAAATLDSRFDSGADSGPGVSPPPNSGGEAKGTIVATETGLSGIAGAACTYVRKVYSGSPIRLSEPSTRPTRTGMTAVWEGAWYSSNGDLSAGASLTGMATLRPPLVRGKDERRTRTLHEAYCGFLPARTLAKSVRVPT